jgi:hypothetical protein
MLVRIYTFGPKDNPSGVRAGSSHDVMDYGAGYIGAKVKDYALGWYQ